MKKLNSYGVAIYLILLSSIFLQGCASSAVSRGTASEADKAYIDTEYAVTHPMGSVADSYQNSSQTAKGVGLGGMAGGGMGSLSSSVGVIPGLGIGVIFGGALGAYIDSQTTLADKLENRGVSVIILGDQVRLILPTILVFNDLSSNIRLQAYSTLNLVAEFINHYPNRAVTVAAYTSASGGPEKVNLALSQQQADKVGKYLWGRGINTRLLSAAGYGGSKLVTKDIPDWASDNYRTEITLEKLPV
jgi:outer membrane protein OmpA-like peptidoglycan-associated protein